MLLERGERIEVLRHLLDCKAIWPWPQIEEWIRVVESGGRPDFAVRGTWRLAMQCRNAHLLASGRDLPGAPMHRDQVIAEVERMRAEYALPDNFRLPSPVEEKERFDKWPGVE